ncbi:hypothetical protein PM10SUCC1_05390 [Propionigenium maris DSM 9537]|uniref:SIR2-like domain-containing protein n=1 Tax=Propionigenium maris DSM 9537 TaxID=1123000 RepID=A0A9W6LLS1_9FUSO|nr:SIR2 family protein [Propionigenium maris]GLI55024.1 hypothetical protein PM10SUCC1_05390 [Propionigenium maris DSM 9537]
MSNIIRRIKEGEKLVLWIGDAISKIVGLPTKKDLARSICTDINESAKNAIKDKKSLAEVSQVYLDSISGSKSKLLKKIRNQYSGDDSAGNPLKVFAEAPFVESIITTSIDDLVEKAYGDSVFKVNYYSEDLGGINDKKLYRVNGSLADLNKTIITKQDMRKLDILPIYNEFFNRLAQEINGRIVLFIGYDLDDPDTINNISMVLNKLEGVRASAYFITSSSIINTTALNWLNANEIKLLKQSDMEFIEAIREYMIGEGIVDLPLEEVRQEKKSLLM